MFFGSLTAAVVLFYMILSLENQDVMQFLHTMESDAVDRLLGLVSVLYGFSLFLIFFLVYFAGKYQMERRSHEFGLYLMLGMKRSRLFGILMAEDMWNSVLALLAGLPLSVFLRDDQPDNLTAGRSWDHRASVVLFGDGGALDGSGFFRGKVSGLSHTERQDRAAGDQRAHGRGTGGKAA